MQVLLWGESSKVELVVMRVKVSAAAAAEIDLENDVTVGYSFDCCKIGRYCRPVVVVAAAGGSVAVFAAVVGYLSDGGPV